MSNIDTAVVGYKQASAYLRENYETTIVHNTLSAYVTRGQGPKVSKRIKDGQYVRPVFLIADLDAWMKDRPGQGKRRDAIAA